MLSEFKPLLKNPKFIYLWISQILSQITINLTNFVLLIRLYATTGSSIATSLLFISYALPSILIGPLGAAFVDMVDKRIVLMVTNFLQSLVILLYALIHQDGIFLLYGLAMAYSFLNQFYVPAEAASLPSVVGKKTLPSANSLFFMTQQSAIVVGFLGAGILNHFLGFSTSLYLASFLLFAAFVSVSLLPRIKPSENFPPTFEQGIINFFGKILEGYNFIRENRSILAPFLLLLGFQIILTSVVINTPLIVVDTLGLDINTGVIFVVISAIFGAITGSILVSRLLRSGVRKKTVIENFLILTIISFLALSLLVPELGKISKALVGAMLIFLAGLSSMGIVVPAQTFLQESTPGGLRGRVFGNYWFLVTLATVFPVIFSGTISELFGIRLLLFGIAIFIVSILFLSRKYGHKFVESQKEGYGRF